MKRILFITCALMAAMTISAQSIQGSWMSPAPFEENDVKGNIYFTFGNTVELKVIATGKLDEMGSITFSASIPGTYKQEGKILKLNLDSKRSETKIEKMDFKPEVQQYFDQNPDVKKKLTDGLMPIVTEIRDELAKDLGGNQTLTIKELTATKLILLDEDEPMEFTRVQ